MASRNLPSILLSFAVVTPLGQSISMAFNRREVALRALASYRSAVYNLYLAHASWDWGACSKGKGKRGCMENEEDLVDVHGDDAASGKERHIDWFKHSETTLGHLVQLSDSLFQYLTLPTATRGRHRSTTRGRSEANEVLSTAQEIFTQNLFGRLVMISEMCESLKYRGLPPNEATRIRQWENFVSHALEDLRAVKEYRTLQALRVFGRLFSLLLPPFYATTYVQVAIDTHSLALGIILGILTSLALTGLFECVRQLEDPFVSHVTLDGIDVREELVVLSYKQLMVARKMKFPTAAEFVLERDIGITDHETLDDTNRQSKHVSTRHVDLEHLRDIQGNG
ncbi:hypothetical protein ACHAWF_015413 [Thalassiosira exigua]